MSLSVQNCFSWALSAPEKGPIRPKQEMGRGDALNLGQYLIIYDVSNIKSNATGLLSLWLDGFWNIW